MDSPDLSRSSYQPAFPALGLLGGAPLYVTGEDGLCLTVFNAASGVTVTVTGRVLQLGDVRPKPFSQTLVPATDRSASTVRLSIGDGWLLNAEVFVSGGTPAIGQTFARLSLVHGLTSVAVDLFTLGAGYVTAKMPLSYPGSLVGNSLDGAGALRSITGTTPAAGAEVSETVPTGARWELLAFRAQLVTSAAVATRSAALTLDDGVNIFFHSSSNSSHTAGLTENYAWGQGLEAPFIAQVSFIQAGLPVGISLPPASRIKTVTGSIQGADQWGSVQYLVRERIEGA